MSRLEHVVFPDDAWSEASWWAELAQRPRRAYLVAEEGDLLGYAGLDLGGQVADVMTIAVAPQARGRGLGTTLLAQLHRLAGCAGAGSVMLEVRSDNAPALALYQAGGYEVVRTRRGYYRDPSGGPARDAVIMRKELEQDG